MRVIPRRSKDRPRDEAPAPTPSPADPGAPAEPGAAEPGAPAEPGAAAQPGARTEGGAGTRPAGATEPGTPAQPGTPAEPGATTEPGAAADPGTPAEPGAAAQPGGPTEPGATGQPGATAGLGAPAGAGGGRTPPAVPGGAGRPGGDVPAEGDTRPMPAGRDPAEALGQESFRGGARPEATTAVLPVAGGEAARRRARAAERQRRAQEVKRSRAGRRRPRVQRAPAPARAADQHRSALLVMVLTLGLLIAAVAVTGGLIASSMRTRPVTLAAPLHIYPVAQATPGPCPTGTKGITGQAATGPTCYHLTQGIAIHKVADLRVQKSRVKPGGYDVAVTLRPVDRQAFADLTRATVGRDLAFVVRDKLVTLPRVDMAITDGKVVVTGSPTKAAANQLVRDLKGR